MWNKSYIKKVSVFRNSPKLGLGMVTCIYHLSYSKSVGRRIEVPDYPKQ
jgi:hypothetical protein